MDNDDEFVGRVLDRRQALAVLGMSGVALVWSSEARPVSPPPTAWTRPTAWSARVPRWPCGCCRSPMAGARRSRTRWSTSGTATHWGSTPTCPRKARTGGTSCAVTRSAIGRGGRGSAPSCPVGTAAVFARRHDDRDLVSCLVGGSFEPDPELKVGRLGSGCDRRGGRGRLGGRGRRGRRGGRGLGGCGLRRAGPYRGGGVHRGSGRRPTPVRWTCRCTAQWPATPPRWI